MKRQYKYWGSAERYFGMSAPSASLAVEQIHHLTSFVGGMIRRRGKGPATGLICQTRRLILPGHDNLGKARGTVLTHGCLMECSFCLSNLIVPIRAIVCHKVGDGVVMFSVPPCLAALKSVPSILLRGQPMVITGEWSSYSFRSNKTAKQQNFALDLH